MVESYLIKILKTNILKYKDDKMSQYESRLSYYIKKLNKKCIDIIYNKIDYCYNERNVGLNNYIQEISYLLSKKLFDIMVIIEDNVIINDDNIIEWFNIKHV
jgi:GTPase involved in cell partitioning and DNA repair